MQKKSLLFISLLSLILIACSGNNEKEIAVYESHNPTPEEILLENKDADIFLVDDLVFINAEDVTWVQEEKLIIEKEIGKIEKQSSDSKVFENFTASKLPVGTKVYEPKENIVGGFIYIVKKDNEEIRYVGLSEG